MGRIWSHKGDPATRLLPAAFTATSGLRRRNLNQDLALHRTLGSLSLRGSRSPPRALGQSQPEDEARSACVGATLSWKIFQSHTSQRPRHTAECGSRPQAGERGLKTNAMKGKRSFIFQGPRRPTQRREALACAPHSAALAHPSPLDVSAVLIISVCQFSILLLGSCR